MSKILQNLYLGRVSNAQDMIFLLENKITHIVNVAEELQPKYKDKFKYLCKAIEDNNEFDYSVHFDEVADFIHDAIHKENGTVLVHCYWGINRSATAVIAYLIKYHKLTFEEGVKFTRERRNIISPNEAFSAQLEQFYSKCNGIEIPQKPSNIDDDDTNINVDNSLNVETMEEVKVDAKTEPGLTIKTVGPLSLQYNCKKCGVAFFEEKHVVQHSQIEEKCTLYFVNNEKWTINDKDSRLFCPNKECNTVLGKLNLTGQNCGCGQKMVSDFHVFKTNVVKTDTLALSTPKL